MNERNDFALVPRPPGALEKAEPRAKRILSGIVTDTLALARVESGLEQWCLLGESCHHGIGRQSDSSEAVKWFRMAAEKGHARAQCWLGYCYQHASGVKEDMVEGVRWFQNAAHQGEIIAQYNLGVCFEGGLGVAKANDEMVSWYRKAADRGHLEAHFRLGVHYTTLPRSGPSAVSAELAEGLNWLELAAEKGHVKSQILLGSLRGSIFKDYAEQIGWYRTAAQQGSMDAQAHIGTCYEKGEGVPQDHREAIQYFQKAASQGNMHGQYSLGSCYEYAKGVPHDLSRAVKLYHLAAGRGLPEAQRKIASCYELGHGVRQNLVEASRWYEEAAEQGDTESQRRFAGFSIQRRYSDWGLIEAYKWLRLAAENSGDKLAETELNALRSSLTPEQIADGEKRFREFPVWKEKWRYRGYQECPVQREYRSGKPERLGSLRIVMLDDERFVLDAVRMMLQFDLPNAEILTFTDVDAVLEELEREDPDLFTTDYAHPKIKGDELLRILAARKVNYPILMLSAYAEHIQAQGLLNEFANQSLRFSLISKPFLLEDLRQGMSKHLGSDYGRT